MADDDLYTEIMKIIEGGLAGDRNKVMNYAMTLADNLEKDGEKSISAKIRLMIERKHSGSVSLDSLSAKPVDLESRMEMVDMSEPVISRSSIVMSKYLDAEICAFVDGYNRRDDLLKANIESPNTLLLYGPPGNGKTTTAQYVSQTVGLPLVTVRMDGLISSLLGNTAKNIRRVFDYASKCQCVLFLDEFDAIAKLRDDKNELGELKRVVNGLIQNMDGFNSDNILIAATNHPDLLDSAIWRRFSKVISLDAPDKAEIEEMFRLHLAGHPNDILESKKKIRQMVEVTSGLSYSAIKTIIDSAIRDQIIAGKQRISSSDILYRTYQHLNHTIKEDELVRFLIVHGATHRDMNSNLGIPLRLIQSISKEIGGKDE